MQPRKPALRTLRQKARPSAMKFTSPATGPGAESSGGPPVAARGWGARPGQASRRRRLRPPRRLGWAEIGCTVGAGGDWLHVRSGEECRGEDQGAKLVNPQDMAWITSVAIVARYLGDSLTHVAAHTPSSTHTADTLAPPLPPPTLSHLPSHLGGHGQPGQPATLYGAQGGKRCDGAQGTSRWRGSG